MSDSFPSWSFREWISEANGKTIAKINLEDPSDNDPDICRQAIVIVFTDGSQLDILEHGPCGEMALSYYSIEEMEKDKNKEFDEKYGLTKE